jgi:hypothetical protein
VQQLQQQVQAQLEDVQAAMQGEQETSEKFVFLLTEKEDTIKVHRAAIYRLFF